MVLHPWSVVKHDWRIGAPGLPEENVGGRPQRQGGKGWRWPTSFLCFL
jgi:hypothetical protein